MKSYLYCYLGFLLLCACSENKQEQNLVTDKGLLLGKTFKVALGGEKYENDQDLKTADLKITFERDTAGYVLAKQGALAKRSGFSWKFINDSLQLYNQELARTVMFAVTKEGDGYTLTAKGEQMYLSK